MAFEGGQVQGRLAKNIHRVQEDFRLQEGQQRAEVIVNQCPSGAIQIDTSINPTLVKPLGTD